MKIFLLLLTFFLLQIYCIAQTTQGLVAYYPLDGNANDSSGNGNNGTISGNLIWGTDRFGNEGKAGVFNGEDTFIEVLNSASLNPDSQLTLCAWVMINDTNKQAQNILSKGHDLIDGYYGLGYARPVSNYGFPGFQGHLNIERFNNNHIIMMEPYPIQDRWYFLTLVYDGNNLISYLNGAEYEMRSVSGILPQTEGALHIGNHPVSGYEYYFDGKCDDIRIYNRALSQQEVLNLYSPTEGLVAYYPFNGNTNDESGNGWNGTGTDLTLIQNRFGNANSAYYFNGYSSSIDFGLVPIPITNFSISVWINSNEAGRGVVLLNAWLDRGFALEFLFQDGTISFEIIQSSSIGNEISVPIVNNSWHHIVATCDNDLIKLFIDGVLIVSKSGPVGTQSDEKLSAGFDHTIGDYYYYGSMDDIRIYNRVLMESEILELYHEGGWPLNQELNTIIITHGFTHKGTLDPITESQWQHYVWQFAMADCVSNNRDIYLIRQGQVHKMIADFEDYQSITQNQYYQPIENIIGQLSPAQFTIDPNKDNVFIFDWTLESAINKYGFAEAGADVLAATLVNLASDYPFLLKHLHFIGHSRGCVVNSEAIERLIYWASNDMLPEGVNLDPEIHMTTLDPHPAGHWGKWWWFTNALIQMDDDLVNSANIKQGLTRIGIVGWKGDSSKVSFIDNYYQENYIGNLLFIGLNKFPGLNVNNTNANTNLTSLLPNNTSAHNLVHTWFHGTVDTVNDRDNFGVENVSSEILRDTWYNDQHGTLQGFYYSRNRLGDLNEVVSIDNNLIDISNDFNYGQKRLIFNGEFTKGYQLFPSINYVDSLPGWSYQAGFMTAQFTGISGKLRFEYEHNIAVHNNLLIPRNEDTLWLRIRVKHSSTTDKLNFYFDDELIGSLELTESLGNFTWQSIDIPAIYSGKTIQLKIELTQFDQNTEVLIDDIGFVKINRLFSYVACPVDFHIYDNLGNHTGPTSDTTYVEEIPGSEYYIYEDSTGEKIKTVFLEPLEGSSTYTFKIESRDTTSFFNYEIEDYTDTTSGTVTFKFDNIAIEPNTVATCTLETITEIPLLNVDIDGDGVVDSIYTPIIITAVETESKTDDILPTEFQLFQNFPNPFNPTTTLKYQIPELSFVTINVYDILGREVVTLINEEKPAGAYEINFNAQSLASGIYFYQLQAGDFIQTKKMLLMK